MSLYNGEDFADTINLFNHMCSGGIKYLIEADTHGIVSWICWIYYCTYMSLCIFLVCLYHIFKLVNRIYII